MARFIRYSGAIIRDDHILLIKHREHDTGHGYWIIPGGGRQPDESEEQCVQREMKEETQLDVVVERLLFDDPGRPDGVYERYRTYLCRPVRGVARPGYEPEPEAASVYAISEVRWFDLRDEKEWGQELTNHPLTFALVQRIRKALGYI